VYACELLPPPGSEEAVSVVRTALGGISEWFDEYIATEEVGSSSRVVVVVHNRT
jgi:hypothetical protein